MSFFNQQLPSRSGSSEPAALTIRPTKRRKRPSFSPQKWRAAEPTREELKHRSQSHSGDTNESLRREVQNLNLTMRSPKTAAVEFEEFSFIDKDGEIQRIDSFWLEKLLDYLSEHYGAVSVSERLPYVVVWCEDTVPPPSERPFIVAGLVAIWLVDQVDRYPEDMDIGDNGGVYGAMSMEQDIIDDLNVFIIPTTKTLSTILNTYFPEALAISYVNHTIIVEFNDVTTEQYQNRLTSLPIAIFGTEVPIKYNNGPIHGREMKREKQPNPTKLNGDFDDTDYVKIQNCFYPGTMLSSTNDTMISAGIQVKKGQKIGVTVAIHCWDPQLQRGLALGTEEYGIKQGYWASGTHVGKVMERIGSTDIGVAKIEKPFSNRFLDLNGSATRFVRSSDMRKVGDLVWIDTFVTGSQLLASSGKRIFKANQRGKDLFGDRSTHPEPGTYIELVQGIYSTSTPEINQEPKIREGVCGAAVLRAQSFVRAETYAGARNKKTSATPKSSLQTPEKGALSEKGTPSGKSPKSPRVAGPATPIRKNYPEDETTGEVAAFMHWSDVQSLYNGGRLLCFADAVDELMDHGWEVMTVSEKGKNTTSGSNSGPDPFVGK